jgi:ribosomal protein S18 acetylase RimI-like enzyme
MLWRVRATLPDRPGALAALATRCGESEVNILGFQVFPGVDLVTDELVLDTPDAWAAEDVVGLVETSGGAAVSVAPCTEAALVDQPTRYVQAAAAVLAAPASFPDVLARLFDAEPEPAAGGSEQDGLDVMVGPVLVQVRRAAPFTATEHARADALATLVNDVLARAATAEPTVPEPGGTGPEFVVDHEHVAAVVDGITVGTASIRPALDEPDACVLWLTVEPAWRRQGIGGRLLAEAVRLAAARDAAELVVTTRADNQAVLPMVLAAGLRGRIRMSGDRLTVRIPLAALHR